MKRWWKSREKNIPARSRKLSWVLVIGLLSVMLPILYSPAMAANGFRISEDMRVYDTANLLSEAEVQELETQIAQIQGQIHMDLAVVTTLDAQGRSAREFADEFYLQADFGTGNKKSGALFLIDMDNREIYISTSGDMIRFLTDSRIDSMLNAAYEGVSQQDYYHTIESFLQNAAGYYKKGIESGQYNYNTETGEISRHRSVRWYEILFAIIASAVSAVFPCLGVRNEYAMKAQRSQASNYNMAYRAKSNFSFNNQADHMINKFVTQAMIPRSSGNGMSRSGSSSPGRSSTHSSGGNTFGGGGRKF